MTLDEKYLYEKELLHAEEAELYRRTGHGFTGAQYDQRIREICDRIGF